MSSSPVVVPKWDPNNFERGKHISMIICASRASGKSYFARWLCLCVLRQHYDLFVVSCSSPTEMEKWLDVLPTELAFDTFKPALIEMLIARNEQRVKQGKRRLNVLLVYDDQVGTTIKSDPALLQVFTRGRHAGISCIFISQSYSLASPVWRANCDIFCIGRNNSAAARKALQDSILSGTVLVPDGVHEKKMWQQLTHTYATRNGDMLIVDWRDGTEQMLHRFRAPAGME